MRMVEGGGSGDFVEDCAGVVAEFGVDPEDPGPALDQGPCLGRGGERWAAFEELFGDGGADGDVADHLIVDEDTDS